MMRTCLILFLLTVWVIPTGASADAPLPEPLRVELNAWLFTEPVKVPIPAFTDGGFKDLSPLLRFSTADVSGWRPRKDAVARGAVGREGVWKEVAGNKLEWNSGESPALSWFVSYVHSQRRLAATLRLQSSGAAEVYFDGKLLGSTDFEQEPDYHFQQEVDFRRGSHLLLVKCVSAGRAHLEAWLETEAKFRNALSISTDPRFAPADFAGGGLLEDLSAPVISRDGRRAAFLRSRRDRSGKKESWLEVMDVSGGKRQLTIRAAGVGNPVFFPNGDALAFTLTRDDETSLWRYDLRTHEQARIIPDVKGLVKYVISPDGKAIYYSVDGEGEKPERDYALTEELVDRMSDWTKHRKLYVADVVSGTQSELTATGDFALDEFALSCEGDRLLFTRRIPKVERPYFTTEFWTYELASGRAELIIAQPIAFETAPANLTWLPGGRSVVYTSCAYLTEGRAAVDHSLSETDVWLLDLPSRTPRNLSGEAAWTAAEEDGTLFYNPSDRQLWLTAVRGSRRVLMKGDPLSRNPEFVEVKTPLPFVDEFRIAADGKRLVFTTSGPSTPEALYRYDVASERAVKLLDPNAEVLPDIQLATTERWNFVNQDGITIEGRLFYPPDFDSQRQWPLVVYYYAGVSPRDDRFTFTYHWWCANGYVLYVLNPVGAVGYGQAFADKHVNDWGTLATRDILEGTDKLLKEKPFLDAQRVAAYGGSYGGFITLDLATKTDKFAALCSMSGISNIASYFGGGQWGFTYGDIALAGSYPWNRRDVFVDKSPVFRADRVKTPLLLTHGTDDVNVPAVESDQMFVALKLLGKDVALVRFKGEDHGFAKWSNRVAERELMLEWFDKHLKGEPEGWERRWKE